MITVNLRHALLRRLNTVRSGDQDSGFALIITMIVMLLITSALAVAFASVTPAMTGATGDQSQKLANQGAQAGIDDFLALASTTTRPGCQTSDCAYLLGTTSTATNRTTTVGSTGESFSWSTEANPNPDYTVRVHSTGTAPDGTKVTLTADVQLTNPFLAYGYYSDYESQSSSYIAATQGAHSTYVSDATTAGYLNGSQSAPTTIKWSAPTSQTICDRHYYDETVNGTLVQGRANAGSNWSQTATVGSNSYTSSSSCDVVFTSGMTFNGPIYTRDAMYISDGTSGGTGPNFEAPVTTLWGTSGKNSPAPAVSTQPWRQDSNVGGSINYPNSYSPSNVGATDVQLPLTVKSTDLPASSCIYYGPTRVVLLGNGTASIISPYTTAPVAGADPACYPSGASFAGVGVSASTAVTVNYGTNVGSSTIDVRNLGSTPSGGWPGTGQKSTTTGSDIANHTVFYLPNNGSAAVPDQQDTSVASSSGCSLLSGYSTTANASCAWSDVSLAAALGNDSAPGWSTYTPALPCGTASLATATDRQLFECEYSGTTGAKLPPADQYGAVRSAIQTALGGSGATTCPSSGTDTGATCIIGKINAVLAPANTTNVTAVTTPTAAGQVQYTAVAGATGMAATGASQTVGGSTAPSAPAASDPLFTSTSTAAQEARTSTPQAFTVYRQVASVTNGKLAWNTGVAQFTVSVTQNHWTITQAAQGVSYFPSMQDVTQYSDNVSSTNAPGDVYIQGSNQGRLSVVADNDVIVTGDLVDTSANSQNDAVDLIATNNVRDYHPVSCKDQTAADINATSAGWCPNDINGVTNYALISSSYSSNGGFAAQHPAVQYVNLPMPYTKRDGTLGTTTSADPFPSSNPTTTCPAVADSTSYAPSDCREIDAAVFALTGSLLTDNYNRGLPLGSLAINGGIYQAHRGANGKNWGQAGTKVPSTGVKLQYRYLNLQRQGLPFIPASTTNSPIRPWAIVSISSGSGS